MVEFGIDITSEDTKTIVHHKVAARCFLVMNAEDAAQSSRWVAQSRSGMPAVARADARRTRVAATPACTETSATHLCTDAQDSAAAKAWAGRASTWTGCSTVCRWALQTNAGRWPRLLRSLTRSSRLCTDRAVQVSRHRTRIVYSQRRHRRDT